MSGHGDGLRDVTVADVAARAGVAKATAARALGDYGAVSAKVRARVQDAASALGYRPNAVARSMSTGRSKAIGIIVGDIENSAFAQATRGAADVAEAAGYDLILSNSREEVEAERKAIDLHLAKRVDGLVIAPASSTHPANFLDIVDAGRPLVFFDRIVHGVEADAVVAANREGATRLADVLLQAGHRRIAYVSALDDISSGGFRSRWDAESREFVPGLQSSVIAERITGFTGALQRAGIGDPLAYVRLGADEENARRIVSDLVTGDDAVTAIVASDSMVSFHAFRAIRDLGLRIPDDISLVGFDNAPWTSVTEPAITVISQPSRELGALSTQILIERIEGATGPMRVQVLPQELIERGSVSRPRG